MISVIVGGETSFEYILDSPSAGYGGGSIYVSPDDQYLLFLYYSGQSEEAFKLFKIEKELELLYDSGYQFGEAADYCFSKDNHWLIQCLPYTCCEWWEYAEDWKEEKDGERYFHFGDIRILDLWTMILSKHNIYIDIPDDWHPQKEDYDPMMSPQLVDNQYLEIQMPWGKRAISFPLEEEIIFQL